MSRAGRAGRVLWCGAWLCVEGAGLLAQFRYASVAALPRRSRACLSVVATPGLVFPEQGTWAIGSRPLALHRSSRRLAEGHRARVRGDALQAPSREPPRPKPGSERSTRAASPRVVLAIAGFAAFPWSSMTARCGGLGASSDDLARARCERQCLVEASVPDGRSRSARRERRTSKAGARPVSDPGVNDGVDEHRHHEMRPRMVRRPDRRAAFILPPARQAIRRRGSRRRSCRRRPPWRPSACAALPRARSRRA